ncbi:TonB-dependent receptor [Flavobacterium sp. AS60]|uniref:TonB-dependent receptor n=1 Tax=Flavobacterium anseongense TaxID=2910677 RepID=UPI001F1C6AD4|nr:TonB-dependent receptor [Flavobacterium sp. AS60]MCF6130143.1 TonB-dependent receptor [Flavobacterium sp. AS60]
MKNSKKYTYVIVFFLIAFNQIANAQQNANQISGVIIDKANLAPLSDANIIVKNSNISVVADGEGKFVINAELQFPIVLLVSNFGYNSKKIELSSYQNNVVVELEAKETQLFEVLVTSRRRTEVVQDVPIPIAVVTSRQVEESGSFNVNRVKELVPSVQLYSSNPRNTTLNIRGLGSTFGLTNDGIDPGVGFYVDGVYYARPAATSLDFIDIERIEVARGPQGTLFGKNTTAGAFNITTKKPNFIPSSTAELSYGNYGYIQAKSSINGELFKKLAGRLSFSGTQRDGVIDNVRTGNSVNDINNLGVKGQLLYAPNEKTEILLSGDFSQQKPDGYAQVLAGVVTTQRAAYRQFNQIIADLGYELPSLNAFDRKIDHDTPWRSNNDLGGVSLNIERDIAGGTLTSTTAWRYWNWDPSNDRDFTGLSVLRKSQAPSIHNQISQEVRYAGDLSKKLSVVFGVYAIGQDLKSSPYHTEESGDAQWRFSQSTTSSNWATPGLFEGYGIKTRSSLKSLSGAVFGQLDWALTSKLHILPGLRYNYDEKEVDYDRKTYGGLETTDPALIALKRLVYSDQAFKANVSDNNYSGQLTVAYKFSENFNSFGTYARSFKPVGVNLGGLPTASGVVLTDLAVVKPEEVEHFEFGVKTNPTPNSRVNVTIYSTNIKDYQTQVQTAELGVNRGYLANAEKVRVQGIELEGNVRLLKDLSLNASLSYTDGKYVSFKNAPVPLEETGSAQAFKDVSGGRLPGVSKWSGALGSEYAVDAKFLKREGRFFVALDSYFRSEFSSSASPSKYLNVEGYALFNGRFGFRVQNGLSVSIWARNLLNKDYYEQLLPGAGNAGHYAGVLGDPRTYGITLKYIL